MKIIVLEFILTVFFGIYKLLCVNLYTGAVP